jgi:hypothetical protein
MANYCSFWPICLSAKTLTLAIFFLMESDRAFIFHPYVFQQDLSIGTKMFDLLAQSSAQSYHLLLSQICMNKVLLTLTFDLVFKNVIGLSHFIYAFLMTRPFYWYPKFWHIDFDLEFWRWWPRLEFASYRGHLCFTTHLVFCM